jgi:hypothetical protein
MDGTIVQTVLVGGILSGAALYLGRRLLLTLGILKRPGGGGCAGGCDCSPRP